MEKNIINTVYHAAVVSGIAIGTSRLTKMISKVTPTPKLALNFEDVGLVILHISSAMYIKDYLVKQKIIPENIDK